MTFNYSNNLNMNNYVYAYPHFRAQSFYAQPAENNDLAETAIDKFVKKVDEEREKKHNKTAIAVGGGVISVSLLVAALNPRISSKMVERLKAFMSKNNSRIKKSKGDLVATKFYKAVSSAADWTSRLMSSTNNINSVKDTYFKQLCTEEKNFFKISNINRRNRFQKIDKVIRKTLKTPYNTISRWGDNLAKRTVLNSYNSANLQMNKFERLLSDYIQKLPEAQRQEVLKNFDKIREQRKFFEIGAINSRFSNYEKTMSNLNSDIRKYWNNYKHGFENRFVDSKEHFNKNLSFWAQDILKPERDLIETQGKNAVDALIGNGEGIKGGYRAILEMVSQNLSAEEKSILEKSLNKAEKSLRKANTRECADYFDKKRDLVLGSAPTDILTAIIGLTIGGVTLASADDKDERISRLLTKIVPTVAGIGTNIALTSMLFSGVKGMAIGTLTGAILSLTCSKIDKHRIASKEKINEEPIPTEENSNA